MDDRSYVVIEDDPEVTGLLAAIIGEYDAGATVRTFSGLPSLDEIADPPPRAIILDLTIWGQPIGLAFLGEIRAFQPLADVAVLICTAGLRDASRFTPGSEPRVSTVMKPFTFDEFVGALRALEADAGLYDLPLPSDHRSSKSHTASPD